MSTSNHEPRDLLRRDRAFDFRGRRQTWRQFRESLRRDRQFQFVVKAKGRKQEDGT
jgi:hypothetical protein